MSKHPVTSLAAIALLSLSGCSAPESPAPSDTAIATVQRQDDAPPPPRPTAPLPAGDCPLLSPEEIEQAFGGALTVKRMSGHGDLGRSCTVSLVEGEDSQLVFQTGGREAFDFLKEQYSSQPKLRLEPIDVGVEAYMLNQAQIIAIDGGGRSLNMGLMLIVFDSDLPVDVATVASGLQSLARRALARSGTAP